MKQENIDAEHNHKLLGMSTLTTFCHFDKHILLFVQAADEMKVIVLT